MSAYLLCLSINGGIPLFTRKNGDLKSIPFPLLASLNGVAMFGQSHDVTLLSTMTRECRLLWRDYHNSVRLIVVVPLDSVSDFHIHRLLDNIFQCLVLLVGLDDLIALRNIDRVKRELRASFGLIDCLLNGLQPSDKTPLFCDLIGAVDVLVCGESGNITNYLDNFTESVDSTYGCVLAGGRLLAATSNWWSLHPDELCLLSLYIWTEQRATLSDTPVFLPVKSPTVPFRLVVYELQAGLQVCVLCGPQPSLAELERMIVKHWRSCAPLLSSLHSSLPRCLPPNILIDRSVLGLVLVNTERKRVLACMAPHHGTAAHHQKDSRSLSLARKLDITRTFYRTVVGAVLPSCASPSPHVLEVGGALLPDHSPHIKCKHQVSEVFSCSEYHKCLVIQSGQYQLFSIFISAVPNHSMRAISHRTLQALIKEKHNNIIK